MHPSFSPACCLEFIPEKILFANSETDIGVLFLL